MKHFFEWFAASGHSARPWLMLGKGPSFDKRSAYELDAYLLLSLNHVVREGRTNIAHMIDIEVVAPCEQAIEQHADVLVMPWIPHVGNLLGTKTLAQWVDELPVLKRLDEQGRLLWYDLSTSKQRHGPGPVVRAAAFSAEAALNLLALAGVAKVRSLGIDGGNAYGSTFDDLKDVTRLNNRQPSYDLQFQGFARTISSTGVDYAPLDIESPIRVYVGSQEEQMLSVRVLEHSIRRHASMSVEVHPLHRFDIEFATPKDPKNRPRTPFSFQRFTIPMLAGHRGRAIYLDSDMQVFRDIRRLWTLPFDGEQLLAAQGAEGTSRRPQFSVMLLDCATLDWTPAKVIEALDSGRLSYEQLMHEMALAPRQRAAIPATWNSLEAYDPAQTCLLHYTDMSTQPWVYAKNRNGHLWMQELVAAVDDGFIRVDEIREHIDRGWVRPSLLKQVMARRQRLSPFTGYGWFADRGFVAPYRKLEIA
jgi:Glycosyl transferase family 8